MKVRILLASALLTASVLPAGAQSIKVSFHGGRVDLSAENATVRAILAEWARVGGTRLVNADRLAGPPVTVEFKDAYERPALEALLRGVSGYIVGPRLTAAAPTSSGFDRIVILATSNAAPRPNPISPVASRPPGPQPLRRLLPGGDDQNADVVDDNDPSPATGPGPVRAETPADLRRRLGQLLQEPRDGDDADTAPSAQPTNTPANPFGVTTGASRPGVITPVPAARPQGGAPDPRPQEPQR
jgi:hypothetical protein